MKSEFICSLSLLASWRFHKIEQTFKGKDSLGAPLDRL